MLTRNLITLLTNVVIFIFSFACIIIYNTHIRDSTKINLITQHHDETNGTEIFIKSYSAKSLSINQKLYGEISQCEDFLDKNASLSEERVLLIDPTNTECENLLQMLSSNNHNIEEEFGGALILADWDYRSSSPFPYNHKNLNLSFLLASPHFPVVSIAKLD
jgi:hypothetical protein